MEAKDDEDSKRKVSYTYDELLEQNKSLSEELSQCRADKEFVWNLWKRLQAEKPDVSTVVGMVVAREQEKAENKDKKILGILKEKDKNIKILEEIAADLEIQLKQSMERLSGLLVEKTEWQTKMEELQKLNSKLKEENTYQQEVMKAVESQKEKDSKKFLERIDGLEQTNKGLEKRVIDLEADVDRLSKETSTAATLMETNTVLQEKIQVLEKDLELTKREYEERSTSMQARESQLIADNDVIKDQLEQIEQKEMEVSSLRMQLNNIKKNHNECLNHLEEQNNIIKNLELLQDETQQVLRNQQESHKSEVMSYKRTLNDLRQKCLDMQTANEELYGDTELLKQSLNSQEKESIQQEKKIIQLEEILKDREKRFEGFDSETQTIDLDCLRCKENEEIISSMKEDLDHIQDLLHEKVRRISSLEKVLGERRNRRPVNDNAGSQFITESNNSPGQHTKSENRIRDLEKAQEEIEELLMLKDNELKETKKAHQRRLHRYRTLQENYAVVTKQLQTYEQEAEEVGARRVNPRSLQHENDDSVWNELAFFKKQHKILKKEREELEEEIDHCRVQSANDASTIKQLKVYLQQEQDKSEQLRNEVKGKDRLISPSKVHTAETQLGVWKAKTREIQAKLDEAVTENEALKQRERYYKAEIMNLTDEIDHIHNKIKNKIDAEVQASEIMETIEMQTNLSMNRIADSLGQVKEATPIRKDRRDFVEQMSQTSPFPPLRNRYMMQHVNNSEQSTQTADNYTSSEEEISSWKSPGNRQHSRKHIKGSPLKNKLNAPVHSVDDIPSPRHRLPREKRKKSMGHLALPYKKKAIPPKSSPVVREQASLRLRIHSLQKQVQILRDCKAKLTQNVIDQQKLNENLKGELSSVVKKLDVNKMSIQKLTDELEKCNRERNELEKALEAERRKPRAPDIGYKEMEGRWKLATAECSKLSFQVRTLRGENEMMTGRQKEFQERILRLERQLNQKKDFVDDLRAKLKEAKEDSTKHKEDLDEVKKKNKAFLVKEEQQKTYVEDLRNKINMLSLEKLRLQENLQANQEEVKRKSRLLQQSQDLCSHAEKAVNEMENAAYDQLQDQATQHEKVQMKIKDHLTKEQKRTKEYQHLVRSLVEELVKESHKTRVLISEKRKSRIEEEKRIQNQKESMIEARDIACGILNMTSEDLKAFMEDERNDQHITETNDNDLREKLEEIFKKESKFSKPLLKCVLELIDHNWTLRMQEIHELNLLETVKQNNS